MKINLELASTAELRKALNQASKVERADINEELKNRWLEVTPESYPFNPWIQSLQSIEWI